MLHLVPHLCCLTAMVMPITDSVDRLPVIPAGARTRTDWPTLETFKFLKACSTQEKGKGWSNVIKLMYDEELFHTDRNLKKKLTILITTFEAEGKQWPFEEFIAKYLEDQAGKADTAIDQAIFNASRPPRQEMSAPKTSVRAAPTNKFVAYTSWTIIWRMVCSLRLPPDVENLFDVIFTTFSYSFSEMGAKFDYAKTLLQISE